MNKIVIFKIMDVHEDTIDVQEESPSLHCIFLIHLHHSVVIPYHVVKNLLYLYEKKIHTK